MSITLIIIIITAVISISAFNNEQILTKMMLWPKRMDSPNEYYRLLSSGFVHSDWMHLIFNMLTLYFFGPTVEELFAAYGMNPSFFGILYVTAIIASSLPSFIKHKNNAYYRSLGASGGVSAVLFAFVYFAPWHKIYIFGIIPIWSILAAVAYVGYSYYMSKQDRGNVNHDAHLWGAIYGFVFTILFAPDHGQLFLYQITHPSF